MPGNYTFSKMSAEKLRSIGVQVAKELTRQGEQSAFLYYEDSVFRAAGHGPITSVVSDVAHKWEASEDFHIVQEPVHLIKLPTPPDLQKITGKDAKAFCKKWLPFFLGYFPGYNDPLKKPTWYPIEWSSKRNKDKNREDCVKIIAEMYKEYGGIEVPFSTQICTSCNADIVNTTQQQAQASVASSQEDYISIDVGTTPANDDHQPVHEVASAQDNSSLLNLDTGTTLCVRNQPLATWQLPPPTADYYQHPMPSASVEDYWSQTTQPAPAVPMIVRPPETSAPVISHWSNTALPQGPIVLGVPDPEQQQATQQQLHIEDSIKREENLPIKKSLRHAVKSRRGKRQI